MGSDSEGDPAASDRRALFDAAVARFRGRSHGRAGASEGPATALAPVPAGWTYLIHGTDTARSWDLAAETVTIRPELSAITLEDRARAARETQNLRDQGIATGGFDTTRSYSTPRTRGAEPVEMRIVFPREDLSSRRRPQPDAVELAESLDPETRRLVTRYHQDRHAVVPRGETLVRIGEGPRENGRRVLYYVPEKVARPYADSVAKLAGPPSPQLKRALDLTQRSRGNAVLGA